VIYCYGTKSILRELPLQNIFAILVLTDRKISPSFQDKYQFNNQRYRHLFFAMLASVLRSQKAVEISIFIVRASIRIREILSSNKELAQKIQELEREQELQNRHINAIYSMFDKLLDEPIKPVGPMGFVNSDK